MNFLRGVAVSDTQVRCGNLILNAPQNIFPINQKVTAAIRPEDVRVLAEDSHYPSLPNVVTAEVQGIEFLGAGYLVNLLPEGDSKEAIAIDLSVYEARQLDLGPGSLLQIQLPPESIQVFAA